MNKVLFTIGEERDTFEFEDTSPSIKTPKQLLPTIYDIYGEELLRSKLSSIYQKVKDYKELKDKHFGNEKMTKKVDEATSYSIWFICRYPSGELDENFFVFMLICFSNIYISKESMDLKNKSYRINDWYDELLEKSKIVREDQVHKVYESFDYDRQNLYITLYNIVCNESKLSEIY